MRRPGELAGGDEYTLPGMVCFKASGKLPDVGNRNRRIQVVTFSLQPPCALAHGQHHIDDEMLEKLRRLRKNSPQQGLLQTSDGARMGMDDFKFFCF